MSESQSTLGAKGGITGASDSESEADHDLECSICLQPAVHPVQLPCTHIFCFLCVKGSANRSKRCALCRQVIPPHYLFKPTLLKKEELNRDTSFDDGQQWYYEGNRGWWKYDERTSNELEAQFKAKCEKLEVLIAGFLYIVDFENMIQYRRNDPSRRRRIKRDVNNIPIKGVAGLKVSVAVTRSGNDRREGDGGFEVDANQNQPSNTQSNAQRSRSLPNTTSDEQLASTESTSIAGDNVQVTDRLAETDSNSHHAVNNDSEQSPAFATSNADGDHLGEPRTDINSNQNTGEISAEATSSSASSNTVSCQGQTSNVRDSTVGRDDVTGNRQSTGVNESGTSQIFETQTDDLTGNLVDALAQETRDTALSDDNRHSPSGSNIQQPRMQLRSRNTRSAKRHNPNL